MYLAKAFARQSLFFAAVAQVADALQPQPVTQAYLVSILHTKERRQDERSRAEKRPTQAKSRLGTHV